MKIHNTMYDTTPVVVHNPGNRAVEKWHEVTGKLFSSPRRIIGEIEDTTIITWNNKELGYLERSLSRLGVPYRVLGRDRTKWMNRMKIDLTLKALDGIDTKYVIGVDSCDAVFVDDPHIAIERFARKGCKMIFNGTPSSWPDLPDMEFEPPGDFYQFLNAGAWIAEARFAKTFWERCLTIEFPRFDDRFLNGSEQKYVRAAAKHDPQIGIDSKCEIFQLLHPDYPASYQCVNVIK
jgi:hypothetical protein